MKIQLLRITFSLLASTAVIFLVGTLYSFTLIPVNNADDLEGGWSQEDGTMTHILLISGNYFSWTEHQTSNGAFGRTKGGSWKVDGNQLEVTYEFDSGDSTLVGTSETWKYKLKSGKLKITGPDLKGAWESIDAGVDTPLSGPWIFSGRKRDGEVTRVDMTTRPRKTMKMLTGQRFQWIAFNTETGKFHGSGGGSYTAVDGVYTENIEFFSRDDNRVGASLKFQFEVKDGDWHHSGKSSSGKPMYEFWSRRE